ncbi:carboxylesterase [Punctularia strigosozonata HHB-11173 SS5]|uniref:carboxylesterase n=1 Tax=Punctularia strigosozonata (strain HHB-11173) TaxID=741275 RepID=UPI000441805F|nr:carboxylesterase [Punctularia strigosozonata HHB-11173 SS5]EIN08288.1 carboxylesterase [Punctularia strigosozonata HHB-11173 SS5]
MTGPRSHLQDELAKNPARVTVQTRYGPVTGGRANGGPAVFLEIPFALPPERFSDPVPLPPDYKYEDKEYLLESAYGAQPKNDGQAAGVPYEDKVGLGKPTENPLFVNVVVPSSFPEKTGFPVKVYIHGGFLQFGSPHGLSAQAQYITETRSEIWVNIGYRLSAFGFLASDEPKVDGNYGFKDQWLGLLWVKDNIASFGGNPNDIQLSGLSAGAHSVHQILHHISHLPEGVPSPIHSAILQSNGIVNTPKSLRELRPQFRALCSALGLDPDASGVLSVLRDARRVPWASIAHAIENLGVHGTFRGALDGGWLPVSPDSMTWQRSGDFARALRAKGVRSIVVGDLTEEWYLYSIAHPIHTPADIHTNLERYYPADLVHKLLALYDKWPPHEGTDVEELQKLFGEMLSEGQVHLPVRLLHRDLAKSGFPVLRYEIRWTPEQLRPFGYVTHGTDRSLWALRLPSLKGSQADVAKAWLDGIAEQVRILEEDNASSEFIDLKRVYTLKEDKTIGWTTDARWDGIMRLTNALPGESGTSRL